MNILRFFSKALIWGLFLFPLIRPTGFAQQPPSSRQSDFSKGFAELAEKLSPAVVNISTSQNLHESGELPAFPPGSPLERFNDFLGGGSGTTNALGSGFIIDPDGIIITNNHVIEEADIIEVTLSDGQRLVADLVGHDEATDIAILRVKATTPLPFVSFGDSDSVRVGDWVIAIGNPFGYGGSLTAGVISARNRDIHQGNYDDFIQTDVAINRGNSGGPLFNLEGHVIGVNTAILSPTGYSVGISFTTPANLVRPIVRQLLEYGETRRGWLGVRVQTVTPAIAESYGLKTPSGALVKSVKPNGPAYKAGLQVGDLLLNLSGKPIENDRMLPRITAATPPGTQVTLDFLRGRERFSAQLIVGTLEKPVLAEKKDIKTPHNSPSHQTTILGLTLVSLDDTLREQYTIASDVEGVLVTGINPKSDAAGKIRVGDVIEKVAWEAVSTPEGANARAKAASKNDKPVLLLINRGGELIFHSVHRPKG